MSETVIATRELEKKYGERTVVRGLDLHVRPGRAYGLLGPNGAGKTTTLRLITGLIAPTAGTVSVFGEQLTPTNADRLRERIGVQTDTELYATLTARENLEVWGGFYGLRRSELRRRADEVLEMMSLSDRASSAVGSFSKGMRQKLAVGRALLPRPHLLFLDEPTAGLDPEATEDLIADLTTLMRDTELTVVICTHQLAGLDALCSDVGVLVGGALVAQGDIDELIARRWPTTTVRIDVAGDPAVAAALVPGAALTPTGIAVQAASDADTERAIAALAAAGVRIHAAVPQRPTVQDLYFATVDDARRSSIDSGKAVA
ncbi:ABC transporter ATP-binding protein [Microbacterium sp. GXS0129]|uniref:ABC transporter ATP-binding protein n=1 Tax=Microbacterium sp. GXS0129 TaxID=3377836 RepID=UPI00383A1727